MSYLVDTLHFSNQHDSDGEELVDVHVVVQSEKQANSKFRARDTSTHERSDPVTIRKYQLTVEVSLELGYHKRVDKTSSYPFIDGNTIV